jgi:EAL domain-containing protein (putative c-di-GMP-specific phosphodiesterase class I)/ActR/RegA family two-component response regulator
MTEQRKEYVLLVDDDFSVRRTHAKMLTRAGLDLIVSPGAEHALHILKTERIGAIVTDLHMPGMDGIEFMRALRAVDLDVPVLVVTGYPSLETAVASIEVGVFRYLMKPVLASELVESVRLAFSMHRLALAKRRALELYQNEPHYLGDRTSLEASFERALEEMWIAFQPIVNCREREIIGYEALVRSNEATMTTPEALVGAAERLGRLHELGNLVRAQVVRVIDAAPIQTRIFVNLHASDLTDEALYQQHAAFSQRADRIVLEVTERSSLDRVTDVPGRVKALRKLGFKIAVDDLGAGYAGLSSFSQLNPDIAKLDMSLVRGIEASRQKQSIVRSMIDVCQKELGVDVVCEGVETTAERDALSSLGSSCQQGYLYGRPMAGFQVPVWSDSVH